MNAKSEALTVVQEGEILDPKDAGIVVTTKGLDYESFIGLWKLSKLLVASGMVPKVKDGTSHEERVSQIAICVARGKTVGLDAFQSVESIVPINGRPMIWGNAPLAICRQHPQWLEKGFDEYWEVKGQRQDSHPAKFDDDSITAVCETLRDGATKPLVRKFSVADAKRAGLWGATGKLYGSYPQRMLPARARAYNLNDNFGDALKGIAIRETFDEEVDGKPLVTSGEELRTEIDKRKAESQEQADKRKILRTVKKPGFSYNSGVGEEHFKEKVDSINNAGTIKEAMKQSFPEKTHSIEINGTDIEDARNWVRTIFDKIPIRMGAASMLKDASLRNGKWISYENIENIDDVEYLNSIAANLEDALKVAVGEKA